MLVLNRKADQEIMIGDDITVTVVRIEGNRVRIGISAPRDVRILRGELAAEEAAEQTEEFELSERELPFAHDPATEQAAEAGKNRLLGRSNPRVFSGSVSATGDLVNLSAATDPSRPAAPLAGFVSAS
ncbi:carbon storage regulator [Stieleria sp. TO1_6]|uniref:carbon storage regulator n=1 Tax=Stieleria tagensis TaxID=2956795 RepID=UPI00209AC8F0|nr:carbon storage regulator [Stieleria tagensis]MCO8120827.1 carbon storage regulator [Stieleria tagensis]